MWISKNSPKPSPEFLFLELCLAVYCQAEWRLLRFHTNPTITCIIFVFFFILTIETINMSIILQLFICIIDLKTIYFILTDYFTNNIKSYHYKDLRNAKKSEKVFKYPVFFQDFDFSKKMFYSM